MGLRMGGAHLRARMRMEESGKARGRIGFSFAQGPTSVDAADVSGFSLVNGRGSYGAKAGIIDLRRADIYVDWQMCGVARTGVAGWTV